MEEKNFRKKIVKVLTFLRSNAIIIKNVARIQSAGE